MGKVTIESLGYRPKPIDPDFLTKYPETGTHHNHKVYAEGVQRYDEDGKPYPTSSEYTEPWSRWILKLVSQTERAWTRVPCRFSSGFSTLERWEQAKTLTSQTSLSSKQSTRATNQTQYENQTASFALHAKTFAPRTLSKSHRCESSLIRHARVFIT